MLSSAEPAPKSSEESLPGEISNFVLESEPEPASVSSEDAPQTFEVEEEEVKKETFQLLRGKDYNTGNLYHYHPDSDIPFTEQRCLHECSIDPTCKAVVFDRGMTRCWGKKMAEHELPLHDNSADKIAYVKKDSYEEAVKKYG
jgi:hypothetical protein